MRAFFTLTLILCALKSFASSPTIGAEVSTAIAQKMLSAPPLPSLDGGDVTITPQVGYVEATLKDAYTTINGDDFEYDGSVKGNTGGLSLTIPTKGNFGYFVFVVASRVHGDIQTQFEGSPSYFLKDIHSESYAGVAGLSYRLIGDENSVFALGLYGGPAYIKINSKLTFVPPKSANGSAVDYTMDPTLHGLYQGVQFVLRMGKFRFNPYLVLMAPLNDACQPVSSSDGTSADSMTCADDPNRKAHADFYANVAGLGLFLGYGAFRINVYSYNPFTIHYIQLASYSASLGISF